MYVYFYNTGFLLGRHIHTVVLPLNRTRFILDEIHRLYRSEFFSPRACILCTEMVLPL